MTQINLPLKDKRTCKQSLRAPAISGNSLTSKMQQGSRKKGNVVHVG